MHNKRTLAFRVVAVLACAGLFLALGISVTAQSNPQDLGEVVWPGEEQRSSRDLAELGQGLFVNGTEPTVIGERPIESFRLERVDNTTTRVFIDEQQGDNHTILQHHNQNSAERTTDLEVPPEDLNPLVHVRPSPNARSHDVLRLTGPPGAFQIDGGTVEQKLNSLADRLGFPLHERRTSVTTVSFPGLYAGERGCLEESGGDCPVTAAFRIDCPDCRLATFDAPEPSSDIERRFTGNGLALFDEQDRMIAATVSYHLDLNESALMDTERARDQAAQQLRDRGHDLKQTPTVDSVRAEVEIAPHLVQIRDIRYVWQFAVYTDPPDAEHRESVMTVVKQDGLTGDVVSVNLYRGEGDVEPGPEGILERLVPGVGGLAALVAVIGASYLGRRNGAS